MKIPKINKLGLLVVNKLKALEREKVKTFLNILLSIKHYYYM
jgi:hypothetical protein